MDEYRLQSRGGRGVINLKAMSRNGKVTAILLVDDRTDTGWTLTVVARLLRLSGADAVYPFVLAATG